MCIRDSLDGSIQGKQEHIHIFDATFYHYKNVCLMMDDNIQMDDGEK